MLDAHIKLALTRCNNSYVNRVIFRSFYGLKIAEENDPYILLGKCVNVGFIECSVPGTFLVDMIPALKYVPDWMPGAGWKKLAKMYREIAYKARQRPWDNVLEKMVTAENWISKGVV